MGKIRDYIGQCRFKSQGEVLSFTIPFGITEFTRADTLESAFERVDDALRQAKNSGRNCCRVA